MGETSRPGQGARLLVVEDQPLLALELSMILEDAGFRVVGTAHDRSEALRLIEDHDPEVALIDVNLRDGLTGPEVARHFCCQAGRAAIFLTANQEMVPGDFAGAIGSLGKPIDSATVRSAAAYALARARGLAQAVAPSRMNLAPGFAGG